MEHCNILIIGGGPAGSSLAWALQDSGIDVVIMDRAVFPRDKVCAGWLTPAIIKTLQLDLENYAASMTLQPIHGFRIGRIGDEDIETYYQGDPVSYGIRRCEFDDYLLQRSGARLKLGESLKQIMHDGQSWIINNAIKCDLVVGAGGNYCPVARYMGAKLGHYESVVAAQEVEFELTDSQQEQCQIKPDVPELFFSPDLKGYGWVFRKGQYINIGLGREDKHNLSSHVMAFCDFLKHRNKIGFDLKHKFNGHAYLLYQNSHRESVGEGVLLVGDAAGLAYSQSGEGIRPAIESAILAARVIKDAQGNYSYDALKIYRELIAQRFGNKQTNINFTKMLPDQTKQFIAKRLLNTHWFVRNIVMNRWFLHTNQHPLLTT